MIEAATLEACLERGGFNVSHETSGPATTPGRLQLSLDLTAAKGRQPGSANSLEASGSSGGQGEATLVLFATPSYANRQPAKRTRQPKRRNKGRPAKREPLQLAKARAWAGATMSHGLPGRTRRTRPNRSQVACRDLREFGRLTPPMRPRSSYGSSHERGRA
jgi:hypothetical protein